MDETPLLHGSHKESSGGYPFGYPRALNHKNPLDDTNIMSLTETIASGLEAINLSHSFSLIRQI